MPLKENKKTLQELKGLGPRLSGLLQEIRIQNPKELKHIGAIEAYLRLIQEAELKPHIGYLYALVGAIENRDWTDVARNDKARLRAELEGISEISK